MTNIDDAIAESYRKEGDRRTIERLLAEVDNLEWQGRNKCNQVLVTVGDVRRMLLALTSEGSR